MDLHFSGATPTAEERAAVEDVLKSEGMERSNSFDRAGPVGPENRVPSAGRAARARRHLLLPVLHGIMRRVGWISHGALDYACRRLDVPPADAYGVATFYGLFSVTPQPSTIVHVCDDVACKVNGAEALCGELAKSAIAWNRSPCLGLCERAPAALVIACGRNPFELPVAPASVQSIASALQSPGVPTPQMHRLPQAGQDHLRLLRRIGQVDPASLASYRAAGGYHALAKALALGPAGILKEVKESKLVGRGGAAFPAGRKWEAVANEPARPHYLVCNADESEPGTFKDRVLMEDDPFAIVESMTIAAFAGGCETGYLYVRGEYPLAAARLMGAMDQARGAGLLGADILGSGARFDIELRRGAGAYICGEETALFNSIEGLRGEPRNKPPFPVQRGLFGKPTIVNNVETLVNVLDILAQGGAAFAAIGTPESTGPKLFCVSGSVRRAGLYEVPFGTKLSELISLAGGVRGRSVQAVLLGGAAGSFLTPAELDMPLSFEGARAANATLGSGAVIVFDESVDLCAVVLRIAAFFRDESCGQCVPCRVGTVRQEELIHRLAAGKPLSSVRDERALLAEIGQAMRDASICGLGQTASSAVESALAKLDVFGDGMQGAVRSDGV